MRLVETLRHKYVTKSERHLMHVPNPGRHAAECKVCSHAQREEIERDFINWKSPAAIAKQYRLANRASVYRHAHALGLLPKRQRNVRAALEKIIERAGEVEANVYPLTKSIREQAALNSTSCYHCRVQPNCQSTASETRLFGKPLKLVPRRLSR